MNRLFCTVTPPRVSLTDANRLTVASPPASQFFSQHTHRTSRQHRVLDDETAVCVVLCCVHRSDVRLVSRQQVVTVRLLDGRPVRTKRGTGATDVVAPDRVVRERLDLHPVAVKPQVTLRGVVRVAKTGAAVPPGDVVPVVDAAVLNERRAVVRARDAAEAVDDAHDLAIPIVKLLPRMPSVQTFSRPVMSTVQYRMVDPRPLYVELMQASFVGVPAAQVGPCPQTGPRTRQSISVPVPVKVTLP